MGESLRSLYQHSANLASLHDEMREYKGGIMAKIKVMESLLKLNIQWYIAQENKFMIDV